MRRKDGGRAQRFCVSRLLMPLLLKKKYIFGFPEGVDRDRS
jgi:hypothetical protein